MRVGPAVTVFTLNAVPANAYVGADIPQVTKADGWKAPEA
ncbi:hypothetical protein SAMN05421874_111222 [Nonomuraea maritima]|uniref:Uncharacterized protein n=1 Tax=Nonomuraea maritima TaxID=683260 RepID=A0A1G9F303_9ACTN|nr:hypothetical protein SAMN05421874_111222 [Nonomuraea maritima]